MLHILKRQMALLLVFSMVLTMLPTSAWAETVAEPAVSLETAADSGPMPTIVESEVESVTEAAPEPAVQAETEMEHPVEMVSEPEAAEIDETGADPTEASSEASEAETEPATEETAQSTEPVTASEEEAAAESVEETIAEETQPEPADETQQEPTVCLSDADCAHAQTEAAWDTKQAITYTKASDTQHTVKGYQYTYCTSCFERVGESFAAEELEDHSLDTAGKCSLCGHSSQSGSGAGSGSDSGSDPDCDHPNNAIGWDPDQLGPWYAQYNDTQHKVTGYRYTYCTDCHARIRDEFGGNNNYYSEEVEDHTLSASGVCTLCGYGYEPPCNHLLNPGSDGEMVSYTDPPRYEQCNEETHYIYRPIYRTCIYCGEPMEKRGYTISNEPHVPENGVCIHCGFNVGEDYCDHENVEYNVSPLDPPRYEQYNETQHCEYHIFGMTCLDCGETLSDKKEAFYIRDHVLNAKGQCTYCGYGMGEGYCTHPASDIMWSNAPMTYTSLDEKQHQVEGCQYHYCTSCYKRISSDFEIVEYENHTFDSAGDCTLCDYRVGCAHSQTTQKLYDTLYKSLNKDSHEVTRLYSKICADPDCGKVLVSVETSYTETDIEDHDFTGNTCLLCNYTASQESGVTVSVYNGIYGDFNHFEATAMGPAMNVYHEYRWQLLLNGEVKDEKVTSSHIYEFFTSEEGDYCVAVSVDNGAWTQSAYVRHTCKNKTVSGSTALVNQSLTHHTVETTTYEECTICHEKRNEVTDVEWVEHTPVDAESYGHEAAHPHKKYFICECGAHPYLDGEYYTANGKVQEEAVCCVCYGHKYGEAEETPDGSWKETCAYCGLTQNAEAPIEPTEPEETEPEETEPVETNPVETEPVKQHVCDAKIGFTYAKEHPHRHQGSCSVCGKFITGSQTYVASCCECIDKHIWGDIVKLPDGTFKQICERCKASQLATPSEKDKLYYDVIEIMVDRRQSASRYQEDHGIDNQSNAIWKTIARQATDKLMEGGFVGVNETLNTFSDMKGSIKGVFTEESWNEQQTDLWESLLIKMLNGQDTKSEGTFDSNKIKEGADTASDILGVVGDISERTAESLSAHSEMISNSIDDLDLWIIEMEQQANTLLRDGDILGHNDLRTKCEKLKTLKDNYNKSLESTQETGNKFSKTKKVTDNIGLIMDAVSIISAGSAAADAVKQRNAAFANLLNDKSTNILQSIINTAKATGNKNLEEAASRLKDELEERKKEEINQFFAETGAFCKGVGEAFIEKAAEKGFDHLIDKASEKAADSLGGLVGTAVKDSMFILDIVELSAKGLKSIVGWGDAYDAAQKLMTVNFMDANLNIIQVLQTEDSPENKEPSAPYMAELWGLLQAEGCAQAQEFLNAWEDNSTQLGIEKDDLPWVIKKLDNEKKNCLIVLGIPQNED